MRGLMELTFLGAAETVTGSKYLVECGGRRVLVDCGLFQGLKRLRLRNWAPFAIPPDQIDAVILTHAHIDDSGYLPLLVRNGFAGRIYSTQATFDLCKLLLPDSGHLQEEEAERANRHGYSKHKPALPLYTRADAEACLRSFTPIEFGKLVPVTDALTCQLDRAGHIIGSAIATLRGDDLTVVFSGDLGRKVDPLLQPRAMIARADYIIVESTYGDREHLTEDPQRKLADVLKRTFARGGVVIIPAFAVGRTQTLLYHLHALIARGDIPRVPIFLDSPMARDATAVFAAHGDEMRIPPDQIASICKLPTVANTVDDSKAIDRRIGPMIVLSASGMATGGRVLFHLERFAPDDRNTILFAGYQAAGTRGALMLAGASSVKIHGRDVPIRAEVAIIDTLSCHADASEIVDWLRGFEKPPARVFITHGEPMAADALRRRIVDALHWNVSIPADGTRVELVRPRER